ncbi:hypothetical protein PHMEG_000627 [Phytophthora megakarya]|uniref:M96 mating-specific protein n=1 Tax=Phytophthora megakarya TaxID=4795 RepID=A0A225X2I9_9STRA|nr:hypothetical protein PHMEG_000627 [Phytophthora megakarya]
MSFLLGADDSAVVEEALAFIDSCEPEETTHSSASCSEGDIQASGDDSTDVGANTKQALQSDQFRSKPTAKKRRIKTFASSSTRQLQRKKAEKSALLEQSLVLQAQLELLKRSKYAALTGPHPDFSSSAAERTTQSESYNQAVTQFVLRQQSEKTNRHLRTILANQERTAETLRAILHRRSVLEGIDFVFGDSAPLYRQPYASDNGAQMMHMLEKRVDNLYIESEAGFGWDLPCLVTSKMNINHNTQYGKVIEIETVTRVRCSIQEASALLWKDLKTVHEIPDKSYRYLRGNKPNSLEKNFVMKLRGQQSDIDINGSHFSRKFEESQRIVIAKADSIVLPTEGLEFRSPSWTTITVSESNPQESVVRNYLRIYAEVQPNLAARPEDVDSARNFILSGLAKMMYGCAQKTQSELVQALVI